MTGQARDEEYNTTNRTAWRNKIISYTDDPQMTGQARVEEEVNTTNRAAWRNKIISYTRNHIYMTGQARDEEK